MKPGRAEAALQRVVRHEGPLHRMQFRRRRCLRPWSIGFARGGLRRHQAAHDRRAVDQHRAGAADAGAADELGSGQAERVAQDIDQQRVGIVGERLRCGR